MQLAQIYATGRSFCELYYVKSSCLTFYFQVFIDLSLYIPDFRSNIVTVDEMLIAHGLDEQKVV